MKVSRTRIKKYTCIYVAIEIASLLTYSFIFMYTVNESTVSSQFLLYSSLALLTWCAVLYFLLQRCLGNVMRFFAVSTFGVTVTSAFMALVIRFPANGQVGMWLIWLLLVLLIAVVEIYAQYRKVTRLN